MSRKILVVIGLVLWSIASFTLDIYTKAGMIAKAYTDEYGALFSHLTILGSAQEILNMTIGYWLATLHVVFFNDFSRNFLIALIVTGFVIGLITRSGSGGFAMGFYVSITAGILLYLSYLLANFDVSLLPYTDYGLFVLIGQYIYPIVANGVVLGFFAGIGGKLTKPKKREKTKEEIEQLVKQAERVCPNCGAKIDSSAIFCSICGTELEKIEIEEITPEI